MAEFIDAHRAGYGVEPICSVLPIAHQRTMSTRRGKVIRGDSHCDSVGCGARTLGFMWRRRSGSGCSMKAMTLPLNQDHP